MEMLGVAGYIMKEMKTIAEGHAQLTKELNKVPSLQCNLTTTLDQLATTTMKAHQEKPFLHNASYTCVNGT